MNRTYVRTQYEYIGNKSSQIALLYSASMLYLTGYFNKQWVQLTPGRKKVAPKRLPNSSAATCNGNTCTCTVIIGDYSGELWSKKLKWTWNQKHKLSVKFIIFHKNKHPIILPLQLPAATLIYSPALKPQNTPEMPKSSPEETSTNERFHDDGKAYYDIVFWWFHKFCSFFFVANQIAQV